MTLTREPGSRTRPRFGILGALSATLADADINLGGRRQRAVVAVLLLARGQQVSTERLLDALWDGAPPPSGAASLQSYVSHLRKALEPDRLARTPSTVLVSTGSGYAMPVDESDVDAWRFESLVDQASAAPDPATRLRLLRDALGLWRGPALAEYAGQEWADFEARRLEEVRNVAREQLLAARLDGGESAIVVPEIEALLAEEPLREERWRLLALALYRSHRQADALAALRSAREKLAEELGVDPGPALRALEAEVLAQSPTLDAPARQPAPTDAVPVDVAPVPRQRVSPTVETPGTPALVDREADLRRLHACLDAALAGSASLALIEGPAGIGKTSLLHQLRSEAVAVGATVLTARGSQLEKEFGFGAVRQLFDPVLTASEARDSLLAGAAAGAGQVFDATYSPADTPTESLFTILHGLYWLTNNLTTRGPVVIAVDDVQWCDTSSLRFLGYLARRLEGLPVLVVATWRTGEHYVDEELLHELTLGPEAVSVQPEPLSLSGTAAVVRERLPAADDAFVAACYRTTSGNPLLLRQLLRALEAEGIRPDASHADTVRAIGSRAVSSMVLMRFRRMPQANRDVARAIAVLGDGASLPLVSSMTGLSEEVTASAVASLARSEVLRPDFPLGFVHPLVESAVYDDLPIGEREMQHGRAAHVLAASGASPERVASHLLVVPPRGDDGVVDALREAAQRAIERGSTESATAYLRRALVEPPRDDVHASLLVELGRLEAVIDGLAAMEHLRAAYRMLEGEPDRRAEAAIMLARTAVFTTGQGEATRIARVAQRQLNPDLVDERQALAALERISSYMHGLSEYDAGPAPEIVGTGPGARGLAASLAWEEVCRGEDRARAAELAHFALEDRTLQGDDPGLLWVVAGIVLELCGENTREFWADELQHAYRSGGLFQALSVHLWLGYVEWQHGDLSDALQSMAHSTEQNDLWGSNVMVGQTYANSFMVCMLLDRGSVDEAEHALALADGPQVGDSARLLAEARAKVQYTRGHYEQALATLDSVQDQMTVMRNPVWRPWRSMRARVIARMGRHDEAVELVEEELELARRWGSPGLVGKTLRMLGALRGRDGVSDLEQAVALLEGTPNWLELTRALADLGACHAEARDPRAIEVLTRALDLADTCAADGLRVQIAERLTRLGVDVPTAPRTRLTLTASERRIAEMAADGLTYPEIAQALFVTTSTVGTIVEAVCERLGVASPTDLRAALDAHSPA